MRKKYLALALTGIILATVAMGCDDKKTPTDNNEIITLAPETSSDKNTLPDETTSYDNEETSKDEITEEVTEPSEEGTANEKLTEPAKDGNDTTTEKPTEVPTVKPTEKPTDAPTVKPTQAPTQKPTVAPTQAPTQKPTAAPTQAPTQKPDANNPYETEFHPLKDGETRAEGCYVIGDFIKPVEMPDPNASGEVVIGAHTNLLDTINYSLHLIVTDYPQVDAIAFFMNKLEDYDYDFTPDIFVVDYNTFADIMNSTNITKYDSFIGTTLYLVGYGTNIGITRDGKWICEQNGVSLDKYNLTIYDSEIELVVAYYNKEIEGYIGTADCDDFSFKEMIVAADYYIIRTDFNEDNKEAVKAAYSSILSFSKKTPVPYYITYPDERLLKMYDSLADVPQYIIDERKELGMELPKF